MKAVKEWLSEYFGFSPRESRGFIIFFLIAISLFLASFWVPLFLTSNPALDSQDSLLIESFINDYKKLASKNTSSSVEFKIQDPNKMNFYDWKELGVDQKLTNTIINYRLKGGSFRKLEDLKSIYGMNDDIFKRIVPFLKIEIPQREYKSKSYVSSQSENRYPSKPVNAKKSKGAAPKVFELIEINSADTNALQSISGIGPVLAKRIVNFRDALGGFVSKYQLYEVYGLDSSVIDKVISSSNWDTINTKKIPINEIDFKNLMKHPYFDYNMTKLIINYRDQHGRFENENDLLNIKILEKTWIEKRRPYLDYR